MPFHSDFNLRWLHRLFSLGRNEAIKSVHILRNFVNTTIVEKMLPHLIHCVPLIVETVAYIPPAP